MQFLYDHTSPETAYVINDYPYGFRLRCKIRYWMEYKPKKGFRLVSQTSNPKCHGLVWNNPKAATYCKFGGAMYLNDDGRVGWVGLTEYSSGAEANEWREKYGAAVPAAWRDILDRWVAAKVAYDANRKPGDHLAVGLPEAQAAFYNTNKAPALSASWESVILKNILKY